MYGYMYASVGILSEPHATLCSMMIGPMAIAISLRGLNIIFSTDFLRSGKK